MYLYSELKLCNRLFIISFWNISLFDRSTKEIVMIFDS